MSWHSTCGVCGELTRYACSRPDSKRDQWTEVLRCPCATPSDKKTAMQELGFDTAWMEQPE